MHVWVKKKYIWGSDYFMFFLMHTNAGEKRWFHGVSPFFSLSAALPCLKIREEDSVHHTFDHNIGKGIVCRGQQVWISQVHHDWLMRQLTRFQWFCVEGAAAFCFWHWRKMADVEEIQEYLWEDLIFHNYSLQVELQALSSLLQNFGDPVSDMFRRDFRGFYAFFQHFVQSMEFTVAFLNTVESAIHQHVNFKDRESFLHRAGLWTERRDRQSDRMHFSLDRTVLFRF